MSTQDNGKIKLDGEVFTFSKSSAGNVPSLWKEIISGLL